MEVKDFRQQVIKKGSYVKYLGTRTTGKVQQIRLEGEHAWIKIDSTSLYYRSDYLLLIEADLNLKTIKEPTPHEKIKKIKKILSTEISDHGDGPGYGGG
ncbi:MAG: DUF2098 family protein [Methanobacteriaceae archaeon]